MNAPNGPTLRSLLQQSIDDLAASGVAITYRQIEEAVQVEESKQPRGLTLNRTTISQILKGTYKKTPTDGTILAIGWLAGVNDDVAYAAAKRKAPGAPFANELPAGVDDLSPKERQAALEILRRLVAQRHEINRYRDDDGESGHDPESVPAAADGEPIRMVIQIWEADGKTPVGPPRAVTRTQFERDVPHGAKFDILWPLDDKSADKPKPGAVLGERLREGLSDEDGGLHDADDGEQQPG